MSVAEATTNRKNGSGTEFRFYIKIHTNIYKPEAMQSRKRDTCITATDLTGTLVGQSRSSVLPAIHNNCQLYATSFNMENVFWHMY
jgi:hypothetical protein